MFPDRLEHTLINAQTDECSVKLTFVFRWKFEVSAERWSANRTGWSRSLPSCERFEEMPWWLLARFLGVDLFWMIQVWNEVAWVCWCFSWRNIESWVWQEKYTDKNNMKIDKISTSDRSRRLLTMQIWRLFQRVIFTNDHKLHDL